MSAPWQARRVSLGPSLPSTLDVSGFSIMTLYSRIYSPILCVGNTSLIRKHRIRAGPSTPLGLGGRRKHAK